jgi:hypothetical protein
MALLTISMGLSPLGMNVKLLHPYSLSHDVAVNGVRQCAHHVSDTFALGLKFYSQLVAAQRTLDQRLQSLYSLQRHSPPLTL